MEAGPRQGIFTIENDRAFREITLEVFRYQAAMNPVYSDFIRGIGLDPLQVREPEQVPFLPVEFFRTHRVICGNITPELIFESSGTTGMEPSRHYVADPGLYLESFTRGFTRVYGDPSGLCILALLPSYLEREGSSLVYMMEHLIRMSGHPESGFYLDQGEELAGVLNRCNRDGHPTLLMGVSYALLDLAEKNPMVLDDHIIVMETGGMKGRRKELVRDELHLILRKTFHSRAIHSEYGMTELLSQAYSTGEGIFRCPPWMKVLIRDPNDPLSIISTLKESQSGGINIIDLANLQSCSFIATGDLGVLHSDGSFEVRGRFDHADVRGCNLMVS